MASFVIEGGHRLTGSITPQGAKNEALQVICATLLTSEPVRIKNIPNILDVNNLIQLLRDIDVEVTQNGAGDYTFRAADVNLEYLSSPEFLQRCSRLRGSILLLGPLTARFGRALLSQPGGDKIGRRRLDTHFFGLHKLGAQFSYDETAGRYSISANKLKGTYMLLDEASVTGTANIIMAAVERGIDHEGVLPGPLNLARKAPTYYVKATGYKKSLQTRGLVYAYALAVSEENASGGQIVTAPTCGASGVVPAVLYHLYKGHEFTDKRILHAMATAGIIGNVVKQNASISGADVGCQGEVGVACAMAAAAACQLFGGSPSQIEYSAEMALEHHLGMTCDPVCGLVQIPCIERNAFAATRALDANLYAAFSDGKHRVSFDKVVEVLRQTGHDIPSLYKETSEGGLAKGFKH